MKRRQFIRTTGMAVTLPLLLKGFTFKAYGQGILVDLVSRASHNTDRVLVVIQLNGGNDGLNTVIPLDEYSALSNARSNILIDENKVLKLNGLDATGLHPAMTGFQNLFNSGKATIVQGVSYPNPNYSHFRATDIWLSASDSDEVVSSGWLGRYLNDEYPNFPTGYPSTSDPDPVAIQIGAVVSPALQGPSVSMGMSITDPSSFYSLVTGQYAPTPNTPAGHELSFIREVASQTNAYASVIQGAAAKATNKSSLYPAAGSNALADQLKIVAQLVAGGLKTRIYMVNLTGFDTHAGQVNTTGGTETGTHATLLGKLSEAISAFQDDLHQLGVEDRVLGMTFSEFGRRIKSNASLGTDHGAGAPLFLFGSQLKGGMIGTNPVLPANASVDDNIAMQFDFRSVYASVLHDWFGVDTAELEDALLKDFQLLPVTNTSSINSTGMNLPANMLGQNYPNPFDGSTHISFQSNGGYVQIKIFNAAGQEVRTLVDGQCSNGRHELIYDGYGLPAGTYYYRMQTPQGQTVKMMTQLR